MNEIAIALGSVVVGALIAFGREEFVRRQTRLDARRDGLRQQRSSSYQQFLESAHEAAHLLGRSAKGSDVPLPADQSRTDVLARLDAVVRKSLLQLELIAEPRTLEHAWSVLTELRALRKVVEADEVYYEGAYRTALDGYQAARTAFIAAARTEILQAA